MHFEDATVDAMPRHAPEKDGEYAVYARLPFLGGVEMMRARFVTHTFSRHFHEEYAMGCIERGAMGFRYLGQNMTAPRGQMNLVVPGEAHDGHAAVEEGWTYRMFYVRPEGLAEAAKALGPGRGFPHFTMGVINDPVLAACVRRTHRILENPKVSSLEKETRLTWLLSNWISRHAADGPSWPLLRPEHGAAAKAREYIDAMYAGDIRLDDLAKAAGLSPFHLARVFEKHYGVPPHAYLIQTRVDRAKTMLCGKARLADIAAETGFADQSHLTRQFKRRFGITPGTYRKIVQNS